jgi:hypothetical protein
VDAEDPPVTRRLLATAALLACTVLLAGHVGSPNVVFDGQAGPYPVRVVVRAPDVIPGQAEISVRVLQPGARRVTVRPVRWNLGLSGAPAADEALPVPGEPELWSTRLWLMDFGSYSVHVAVEGPKGAGTVIVPVSASALRVKEMPRGLGLGLAGLGLFLLVGLLTIIGAASREAVLPPGQAPGPAEVRRSWVARAVALPILALLLLGGSRWWGAEDANYARQLYRAPEAATTVRADSGGRVLELRVKGWTAGQGKFWSPLLPDHGKLMHLFLVRQPGLDAFAHLHPLRVDSVGFRVRLPPLPAGEYRLYADILHESGFPETLTDTVVVPAGPAGPPTDPDDSWLLARPSDAAAVMLADGSTMTWERPARPIAANEPVTLRFRVTDPAGAPARLEPYLGMLAHAAITRDDGSVFVHLHPGGTVSMAAQARFEQITRGDTARDARGQLIPPEMSDMAHPTGGSVVQIPFDFPRPGRYFAWVQVRRAGQILTAPFELRVE